MVLKFYQIILRKKMPMQTKIMVQYVIQREVYIFLYPISRASAVRVISDVKNTAA